MSFSLKCGTLSAMLSRDPLLTSIRRFDCLLLQKIIPFKKGSLACTQTRHTYRRGEEDLGDARKCFSVINSISIVGLTSHRASASVQGWFFIHGFILYDLSLPPLGGRASCRLHTRTTGTNINRRNRVTKILCVCCVLVHLPPVCILFSGKRDRFLVQVRAQFAAAAACMQRRVQ